MLLSKILKNLKYSKLLTANVLQNSLKRYLGGAVGVTVFPSILNVIHQAECYSEAERFSNPICVSHTVYSSTSRRH